MSDKTVEILGQSGLADDQVGAKRCCISFCTAHFYLLEPFVQFIDAATVGCGERPDNARPTGCDHQFGPGYLEHWCCNQWQQEPGLKVAGTISQGHPAASATRHIARGILKLACALVTLRSSQPVSAATKGW